MVHGLAHERVFSSLVGRAELLDPKSEGVRLEFSRGPLIFTSLSPAQKC